MQDSSPINGVRPTDQMICAGVPLLAISNAFSWLMYGLGGWEGGCVRYVLRGRGREEHTEWKEASVDEDLNRCLEEMGYVFGCPFYEAVDSLGGTVGGGSTHRGRFVGHQAGQQCTYCTIKMLFGSDLLFFLLFKLFYVNSLFLFICFFLLFILLFLRLRRIQIWMFTTRR